MPEDNGTALNEMKEFKSEPFDDDGTSSDSDVNEAFMDNAPYQPMTFWFVKKFAFIGKIFGENYKILLVVSKQ